MPQFLRLLRQRPFHAVTATVVAVALAQCVLLATHTGRPPAATPAVVSPALTVKGATQPRLLAALRAIGLVNAPAMNLTRTWDYTPDGPVASSPVAQPGAVPTTQGGVAIDANTLVEVRTTVTYQASIDLRRLPSAAVVVKGMTARLNLPGFVTTTVGVPQQQFRNYKEVGWSSVTQPTLTATPELAQWIRDNLSSLRQESNVDCESAYLVRQILQAQARSAGVTALTVTFEGMPC